MISSRVFYVLTIKRLALSFLFAFLCRVIKYFTCTSMSLFIWYLTKSVEKRIKGCYVAEKLVFKSSKGVEVDSHKDM